MKNKGKRLAIRANQYAQGPFSPHLLGEINIPFAAIIKIVKITGKHNRKGEKNQNPFYLWCHAGV